MVYEFTSPLTVLKSVGPKTVPFFKTVAIFFVLYPSEDINYHPVFYSVFKILPVVSLMIFVLLHGMNFTGAYSYSWKILIGLAFSALGDIFLVFKNYGFFVHGVGAFAMAQLLYAWAFDIWPLKLYVGAVCACMASTIYYFLLPGLNGIMVYIGAIYAALIFTMAWRAIARVEFFNDNWTFSHDMWKWTKLCSCVGALFFVISDFTIAFDKFVQPVPYAHMIIMLTYYTAQFFIAVSVVDSQVDEVLRITREEEVGTLSGNLIRKIQKEAREPVQKIKHGLATASQRIENLDTIKNIKHGINSIENSESVQKIRQGLAEAQLRIETSDTVQIIKQGINRLETSQPVQRLRHRLSSKQPEVETEQSEKETEQSETEVTPVHVPEETTPPLIRRELPIPGLQEQEVNS